MKFRAVSMMMKMGDDKWSDWQDCDDILIVFKGKRITIYSARTQEFDAYSSQSEKWNEDLAGYVKSLECVDEKGTECTIFIHRKEDSAPSAITVVYPDIQYSYAIKTVN